MVNILHFQEVAVQEVAVQELTVQELTGSPVTHCCSTVPVL